MSTPSHKPGREQQDLEKVLALARRADPGEGSPTDARRLARRAVLASSERRVASRTRRSLVLAALMSGAIVLLAAWSPLRHAVRDGLAALLTKDSSVSGGSQQTNTRAPWKPLELAMPTGDRLFASPGAQFDLLENTVTARRIALREGTAVFAVEPLVQGEQFSVQTPHLRVFVRGTVFSVEVDAQRTRVRVHEGAVRVESDGAARSLRAGERYGSDKTAVPELVSEALSKRVAELLVERMQRKAQEAAREHGSRDASVGPGHEPPDAPKHEPNVTPKHEPSVTLERARALMHEGAAQQALAAARAAHGAREPRGEWLVVEGDALRALGESEQAVQAYLAAQTALTGEARALAAFKAADLLLRVIGDPSGALRVIDGARLDAPKAPLRERALLLRIEARHRLGQQVRALARHYLNDYPDSAGAARMRALIASPDTQ